MRDYRVDELGSLLTSSGPATQRLRLCRGFGGGLPVPIARLALIVASSKLPPDAYTDALDEDLRWAVYEADLPCPRLDHDRAAGDPPARRRSGSGPLLRARPLIYAAVVRSIHRLSSAFGLALLAALASPSSASALPIEEPITGLRVQVEAPGADVCRIIPPATGSETAACEGMDVAAVTKQVTSGREQPSAVAVVRFDGWGAVVTVKGLAGTPLVAKESIEEFLDGMRRVMPGNAVTVGERPGSAYDLVKLNGVNAVRTTIELHGDPRTPAAKLLTYVFTSKKGTVAMSFVTAPGHEAELVTLSDRIAATVSMPDAEVENFGRPRAEILGAALGRLTAALLPVLGVVIAVIVVRAQRAKKKAAS
jgi:hypothetical protein